MICIMKSRLAGLIAFSTLLLTAACAVGPRFKKPAAPDVGGYTPAPITATNGTSNVDGGAAQHLIEVSLIQYAVCCPRNGLRGSPWIMSSKPTSGPAPSTPYLLAAGNKRNFPMSPGPGVTAATGQCRLRSVDVLAC
jgi:hypothetical protein